MLHHSSEMSGALPRERHGGRFDKRKKSGGGASSSMGDDPYEGIELTDLRELCRAQHDQLEKLHSPIAA